MNLIQKFTPVLMALTACQVNASNHKIDREIPNDNLHCYPGAWECMQSVLACKQPTQSQAQDLIYFLLRVCGFYTEEAQDIAENFEAAYGYKLTV